MRVVTLCVIAACNSKEPEPKKQPDPWNAPATPKGSAGDPKWVNDPPDVLIGKITGINAHVIVLKSQATFAEYRDVLATAESMFGVVAAEPFIFMELEIAAGGKTRDFVLKAVDPARVGRVLSVGRHLTAGTLESLASGEPPSIILGDVMAKGLGVRVGDTVTVSARKAPDPRDPPVEIKPTVFRVTGTFHLDFDEYDEKLALAPLPPVQAMIGRGDQVMGVEMVVKDRAKAREIAEALEKSLGGPPYQAMDWYALNQNLFTALGIARP